MKRSTLLKTSVIGTIMVALCCFTPILVILLGAIGFSAWVGHLDAVLMPALLIFIGLTVYAFLKKEKGECCKTHQQGDKP